MFYVYVKSPGGEWQYLDEVRTSKESEVPLAEIKEQAGIGAEIKVERCNCDYCQCYEEGCENMPDDFDSGNI